MYIKYRLTDKDREELEKMILLELAMPKYIERIGKISRIILCILMPVELLLSVYCCLKKEYLAFGIGITFCVVIIIFLIVGPIVEKRYKKSVHKFIWEKSENNTVDIDEHEIKISEDHILEFQRIERIFLYKNFFFFMINGKKIFVLILKPSHEELDEVIKIIERTGVPFERREKPFYFYKYCIKNCIRNGIKKNDF